MKITRSIKPFTKREIEFLMSLVRSKKSELVSFGAVGVKVPDVDHEKVSRIEKHLEFQLACLSS